MRHTPLVINSELRFMRLWALITTTILTMPTHAAPSINDLNVALQSANAALASGEYSSAYSQYAQYSDNNPLAQFNLGLLEREGWGRPKNAETACSWFEKAAHKKIPAAQQFLGDCFAQGIGRPVDEKTAVHWYHEAAASGIHYALCSAGQLYVAGKALPQDIPRGLSLCTAAAQAESTPAMLRLAKYYHDGSEVPQDLETARYWYLQAAQHRTIEAQYQLGIMLSQGQGGPVNTEQALSWLEHAASAGYSPAYLPVAILYANATPDEHTGALSPEHLAKIYMWNAAAKACNTEPQQQAEIEHIERLTLAVMPSEWRASLDRQVEEHLIKYNTR